MQCRDFLFSLRIGSSLALWQFLQAPTDDLTTAAAIAPSSKQFAVAADLAEACFHGSPNAGPMDIGIGVGLVRLVQERKLSVPVVRQAKDIYDNWTAVDLYQSSPYGVDNALNMELRERGWELLALWRSSDHDGLTLADYILLIGLQHTLLDTTFAERYSPFYPPVVMRWVSACSRFLDILDPKTDAATGAMLVWVCMKLAGSLTATFLRARSDAEDDPRFRLMIKMMEKYPETREWSLLEQVLKTFHWRVSIPVLREAVPSSTNLTLLSPSTTVQANGDPQEHCVTFWKMVWKMVVNSTIARDGYTA